MSGWIPITGREDQNAAPFDGEPVLIATNHTWCNSVHRVRWTNDVHGGDIFGWAVDDYKHGPFPLRGYTHVSHWMPLPEAPEVKP